MGNLETRGREEIGGKTNKFLKWFKMKILLCKAGKRKILYLIKNFDCLVKFWTLLYSSKTQWSNSHFCILTLAPKKAYLADRSKNRLSLIFKVVLESPYMNE